MGKTIRLSCALMIFLPVPGPAEEKLRVPNIAELKKAQSTVRELYENHYKKTSPEDKKALAELLLKDARNFKSDASAYYVLLTEAAHLAAQAGHVDTTVEALGALTKDFRIDKMSTVIVS